MEDPLAPARGCFSAVVLSGVIWIFVFLAAAIVLAIIARSA